MDDLIIAAMPNQPANGESNPESPRGAQAPRLDCFSGSPSASASWTAAHGMAWLCADQPRRKKKMTVLGRIETVTYSRIERSKNDFPPSLPQSLSLPPPHLLLPSIYRPLPGPNQDPGPDRSVSISI